MVLFEVLQQNTNFRILPIFYSQYLGNYFLDACLYRHDRAGLFIWFYTALSGQTAAGIFFKKSDLVPHRVS